MSKTRGIVLEPEVSVDVEPGIVTLYDMSRFGNNGVMTNVTWVRLPSGLWVMSFNGINSFVSFGTTTTPVGNVPITMECWVKLGRIAVRQSFMFLGNSADNQAPWLEQNGTGGWGLRFWNAGHALSNVPAENTTDWFHIIGTYDLATSRIFVNGIFRDDIAYAAANIGTNRLIIGDYIAGGGLPLLGQIALVRIYSYALTAGQILQRFEATRHLFGV